MKVSNFLLGLAGMSLLAILLLNGTGCTSINGGAQRNIASVTITNRPMAEVQSAVAAVFAQHGFGGGQTAANQFTFSRLASPADQQAYGNEMFNGPVSIKVAVTTTSLPSGNILVGCNGWLVEAPKDPMYQNSYRVRQLREWPYQQLMDEIKARLGE